MSYDTARPYSAAYVILHRAGKIAFVLRANTPWMNHHYGLLSGKVEHGETFVQAAIHEAQEEVGITAREADLRHVLTMHRKADDDTDAWVDVFFEADKWYGEVVNGEPHKHGEVAWLDPDDLPKNTIPSVRFAIEQITAGNHYCEYGWR